MGLCTHAHVHMCLWGPENNLVLSSYHLETRIPTQVIGFGTKSFYLLTSFPALSLIFNDSLLACPYVSHPSDAHRVSSLYPLVTPKGTIQIALEATLMASEVTLSHNQRHFRLEIKCIMFWGMKFDP